MEVAATSTWNAFRIYEFFNNKTTEDGILVPKHVVVRT